MTLVITKATDAIFFKHNREYQKYMDELDELELRLKELELERLLIERRKLEIDIGVRNLEEAIVKRIMVIK